MRKAFEKIKKYSIITMIITAVLGAMLILYPEKTISYTAIVMGGCFILCGIIALINYGVKDKSSLTLTLAIIAVVAGIIICVAYRQIVSIIIFMLGIMLLIGGIVDLVNSIDAAVRRFRSSVVSIILAAASITIGILSIVNPFETQNTIVQVIGGGLIAFSVLEIITYVQVKKIAKAVRESVQSNLPDVTEVDFEEVDD